MYHGTSSGLFAIQMMMPWANSMYAQNTRNASIIRPSAPVWLPWMLTATAGSRRAARAMTATSDIAATKPPEKYSRPKIVEYHSGVSDISQSNDANVSVSPTAGSPAADSARARTIASGLRANRGLHRASSSASTIHSPMNTTERITQNDALRYGALCASLSSASAPSAAG